MYSPSRAARRRPSLAPSLLGLVLIAAAALAACAPDDRESDIALPGATPNGALRLELVAEPINGEAPLAVRFEAELIGEVDDPGAFGCPTLAWTLDARDEGEVVIAQPEGCAPGVVPRTFTLNHTYAAARTYEASVRFIARDVPASNLVQIVVRGPTATPAPRVAFPGPTIVIATPAGTRVALAGGTAPSAAPVGPAAEATAGTPGAATSAASEASPATAIAARPTAMLVPVTPAGTQVAAGAGTPPPQPRGGTAAAGTTGPPEPGAGTAIAGLPPASTSGLPPELLPGLPTSVVTGPELPAPTAGPGFPPLEPGPGVPPPVTGPEVPPPGPAPVITTAEPGGLPPGPTAAPMAPPPPGPGAAAPRVLPADLYYVAGPERRVWRLPASGERPAAVTAPELEIDAFDVAPNGSIAFTSGGSLYLAAPGSDTPTQLVDAARAPLWSRNGRLLAYGTPDGVYQYDIVSRQHARLSSRGEPMAWSRDATWLLVGLPGGRIALVAVETGARTELPFDGVASAGWLADRDVIWMAGAGLRLLSLGQTWVQTTLLPPEVPTSNVFIRPDDVLLALADTGAGPAVHIADLASDDLTTRSAGPPIPLRSPDNAAWAPDGRHMALAGLGGVALVDPFTGAEVPMIALPAARPAWVLGR